MSGRPYARNLRAPFVGATDLDAVLPHTFCISILRSTSSPKERAIRSAIRRRCMEKNWKKMFSLRHKRLSKEEEDEQEPTSDANAAEEAPAAENEASTAESEAPKPEEKPRAEENVDEREDKEDKLASAKLQLLELKKKLQELTDQKHDKFLLLKQILVQEARSKTSATSAPAASGAGNPTKKRRLDAPTDAGGFSPLASNSVGSQPAGTQSTVSGTLDGATPGSAATGASS